MKLSPCFLVAVLWLGAGPAATAAEEPAPGGASGDAVRGTAWARQRVQLAPAVDGTLRSVAVDEGDIVATGDVLAVVDDRVQQARVDVARASAQSDADLHDAELALRDAERRLERTRAAHAQQAANAWEVDEAEVAVGRARAAVDAARERRRFDAARLRVEESLLERHQIRAPFAGRVSQVSHDAGASVQAGEPLLTLVDLSELEAVFFVPVEHLGSLRPGATVPLRAGSPVSRELEARLLSVDPEIDAASDTVRVLFVVANEKTLHPSGFTVELDPARLPGTAPVSSAAPAAGAAARD